jgi:hypothetical protein
MNLGHVKIQIPYSLCVGQPLCFLSMDNVPVVSWWNIELIQSFEVVC